jgi:hypothetical protein
MESHLYEDKEKFVEMANLDKDETGIDGAIYISTKEGNHGPRIKFYRKLGKNQPYAGIAISQDHKILYDDLGLTPEEKQKLFKFIDLNFDLLDDFWKNGHYRFAAKVISQIKKVN